ncbi:MAG: hypothetical protein H0U35_04745 [Sporichthyaceae bacterium]|nr:hypothetical protein [Sporichthyaceae bacterium]
MNIGRIGAAFVTLTITGWLGVMPAAAASGSVLDPRGDFPDILKLAYVNGDTAVNMTMTYAEVTDAQNESFYLHWGTNGDNYQVFESRGVGLRELRYNSRKVACAGLRVIHRDAYDKTKVVIPRSCINKAPNALRFKGIATAGLSLLDQTKKSPLTARG